MKFSLLWLVVQAAWAGDPPAPPEAPKAPEIPGLPGKDEAAEPQRPLPWRIAGFEDLPRSQDCPPAAAMVGACVEEVAFLRPPDRDRSRESLAQWRTLSVQWARMLEGLTWRWRRQDDQVSAALAPYDALPTAAESWDPWRKDHRAVAVPDPSGWLDEAAWIAPEGQLYGKVRYSVSKGTVPHDAAILAGRFAQRLGADGRPFPHEFMDADPADSKPFFEQLYPYQGHAASGLAAPLARFKLPEDLGEEGEELSLLAPLLLRERSYDGLRAKASETFIEFYRELSVQVLQFATADYTVNHMRVLAALTAMNHPPPRDDLDRAAGRGLVAASLGETDDAAAVASRVDRSRLTLGRDFELNPEALPLEVAAHHVALLYRSHPPDAEALRLLNAELREMLGDILDPRLLARPQEGTLQDPRLETMEVWAKNNVAPGRDSALVVLAGQRLALKLALERLPRDERAERETWILLDHGHFESKKGFDAGALLSPGEVVGATTSQWVNALTRHGFAPAPLDQGLGAIDPMSICTTLDGVAALGEPSVGAVRLDLLFVGSDPPGSDPDADTLLWEARQQLPFLQVDDPEISRPQVEWIVGLPDGKAVYRARWQVWSGWHLFWGVEDLHGQGTRIALRTGAVCADTVLAPPELVPTLLSASLLDGRLRGTQPPRHDETTYTPISDENLAWLRATMLAPIERLAKSEGGLLLAATIVQDDASKRGLEVLPPTPYARDHRSPGTESVFWARLFPAEGGEAPLVYPAWRPSEAVEAEGRAPRWSRVIPTDASVTAGAGAFPYRANHVTCAEAPESPGFVPTCEGQAVTVRSEGFSVDAQALTSFWVFDAPRLALEAGMELHLDVAHGGPSWFDEEGLDQAWMFRPSGGIVIGGRGAPLPPGLWSHQRLWGAERLDGTSRLGRLEYGLRAGFLLAPGGYGAEGTALSEVWLARSVRRSGSRYASFTPYNPRALYGGYVRGQYSFHLSPDDTRPRLVGGEMVIVGFRATWDLLLKLPEGPKASQ